MSDDNLYRIKIRKGNMEFEIQGDKEWVESKYKEIKTEIESITIPSNIENKPTQDKELPMTLSEFIRTKKVESNTDEMIIFAYWLFYKEDITEFNIKDIRNCYKDTRRTVSGNPSRDLGNLQRKGFIKKLDVKKEGVIAYTITPTGEEFVESEL